MKVYVVQGCIQFEDFEWIEIVCKTSKGAKAFVKKLKEVAERDDLHRHYYRISKYVLQD